MYAEKKCDCKTTQKMYYCQGSEWERKFYNNSIEG